MRLLLAAFLLPLAHAQLNTTEYTGNNVLVSRVEVKLPVKSTSAAGLPITTYATSRILCVKPLALPTPLFIFLSH